MRRAWIVLLLSLWLLVCTGGFAQAGDGSPQCDSNGDLGGVHEACIKSGTQTAAYFVSHSDHTFTIRPACDVGGLALCDEPGTCHVDGHEGLLYDVFMDANTDPLHWQACLTNQEAQHLGDITPGAVERAFQRLAWPASPMVIQPPNGRTLVNFDTNFYTTNTSPTTQTVTLLGATVTIEATPVDYVWHFGGAGTTASDLTTADPGAAYPNLRVTFRYLHTGDVRPSLDTVYSGRYRIGNGAWQQIPDTLTVTGATQDLQVVSATPHLLGY
jgi:hypothetical protein